MNYKFSIIILDSKNNKKVIFETLDGVEVGQAIIKTSKRTHWEQIYATSVMSKFPKQKYFTEIEYLWVEREKRRAGIGKWILDWISNWAETPILIIASQIDNETIEELDSFYTKCGFSKFYTTGNINFYTK